MVITGLETTVGVVSQDGPPLFIVSWSPTPTFAGRLAPPPKVTVLVLAVMEAVPVA